MFSMRMKGGVPIYEQLEARITELIVSGEMKEDERLPTVRDVAREFAVNPNTVQKTYQLLEQRGLIYSIPSKGSYVAGRDNYIDTIKALAEKNFSAAAEDAIKRGLTADELTDIIKKISKEIN
ncbi:MAG: GntR family transcriptional regulator [Eubacterium sp.]|nr:GntR family transcriptional regulator [Eubacterium sp.]